MPTEWNGDWRLTTTPGLYGDVLNPSVNNDFTLSKVAGTGSSADGTVVYKLTSAASNGMKAMWDGCFPVLRRSEIPNVDSGPLLPWPIQPPDPPNPTLVQKYRDEAHKYVVWELTDKWRLSRQRYERLEFELMLPDPDSGLMRPVGFALYKVTNAFNPGLGTSRDLLLLVRLEDFEGLSNGLEVPQGGGRP